MDWSRGNYSLVDRVGRIASARGEAKKLSRMVAEGSVLFAQSPPAGTAEDVRPESVPHPVYRAGFALSVPMPWKEAQR